MTDPRIPSLSRGSRARRAAGVILSVLLGLTGGLAFLVPAQAAMSTTNTQWNLAGLGYLGYDGVDGSYGPDTTDAVRQFQTNQGLAVSGAPNDQTSDCLMLMMRRVQQAVGADVDGYNGPRTKAAIVAWQRAHGMAGDGFAGPRTHGLLGLSYTHVCDVLPPAQQKIVNAAFLWQDKTREQFEPTYFPFAARHLDPLWCQDFAWYVWRSAGVKDTGRLDQGRPAYQSNYVSSFARYGLAHNTVVTDIHQAQPGDMLVWSYGDDSGKNHVAVVVRNNGDGTLATMNGNATVGGVNKVWLNRRDNGWDEQKGLLFNYLVRPVL